MTFRDAPAGRGTEVEAIVAYRPARGRTWPLDRQALPGRALDPGSPRAKRFKMLMETGEVATNANRKSDA